MGYRIRGIEDWFNGVSYTQKTSAELRQAMSAKVKVLEGRAAEREQRMANIREQYNIDAERLAVLLMRFKNDNSTTSYDKQGEGDVVPAGVIANLVREREMIDNEKEQIAKLELVQRNLVDEVQFAVHGTGEIKMRPAVHTLDDEELEYLGF